MGMVDFNSWEHVGVHPCLMCKTAIIGRASCEECIQQCKEETGHLLEVIEIIDNNWDHMACKYCGKENKSQCKDPRTRDGFSPIPGYMRGKEEE